MTLEEAWGRDRASAIVAHGRITRETIASFVPDVAHGPVLLCGPSSMMTAMRETLVAMGVPDAEIRQEAFASPPLPDGRRRGEAIEAHDAGAPLPDAETAIVFRRTGRCRGRRARPDRPRRGRGRRRGHPLRMPVRHLRAVQTPLLSGRVAMDVQDALSAVDRARGLILARQARPLQPVEIDA